MGSSLRARTPACMKRAGCASAAMPPSAQKRIEDYARGVVVARTHEQLRLRETCLLTFGAARAVDPRRIRVDRRLVLALVAQPAARSGSGSGVSVGPRVRRGTARDRRFRGLLSAIVISVIACMRATVMLKTAAAQSTTPHGKTYEDRLVHEDVARCDWCFDRDSGEW